jgi:osmotically-inducible protein OsmY
MKAMICGLVCGIALVAGPVSAGAALSQAAAVKPSDSTLTERIETRVHQDASLKKHDVKISVDNGVATLTGSVATTAEKARAAQLARVRGITRVDNQIVVDRSTAASQGTKGTLEKSKDVAKDAGEVTKEGAQKVGEKTKEVAKDAGQKTKEVAKEAGEKTKEGVKKVGAEITDAWILSKVKADFVGEDVLKGSDINVDVDQKVVTLRGTVPTAAARARAMEIARKTDGAKSVIDRLTIGPKK